MLKRDLMELCLLQMLSEGDKYGYEMLSWLRVAFPDTRESAAYAVLRELPRKGLAQRYQGEVSEGSARKYYHLTPEGLEQWKALSAQWRTLRQALEDLGVK